MEKGSQNSEKIWLVRSSTRILGPFNLSEVKNLLDSKQISVIDEIREPSSRWSYIRENALFTELIRRLRAEQDDSYENTNTAIVNPQTVTKTDHLGGEELTPTPVMTSAHEVGLRDISGAKEVDHKPSPKQEVPRFGLDHQELSKKRTQARARQIQIVLALVAVVVVSSIFFLYRQREQVQFSGYENLSLSARRYKALGLYEKSLSAYKKIFNIREPDAELQYQMAPLLISEDRQNVLGRRILEKSFLDEKPRREKTESQISLALTYLQEDDLEQAEAYLQKALSLEPTNIYALSNLAILNIKKKNEEEALNILHSITKRQPDLSFVTALRSIAALEAFKRGKPAGISDLLRILPEQIKKTNDLKQELSLLWLALVRAANEKSLEDSALKNFIDQVPLQSRKYKKNYLLDWRYFQWENIERYCSEFVKQANPTSQQKAALAICALEVSRDADASRLIGEARAEAPTNPHFTALEAVYLVKVNRQGDAMTLLKNNGLSSLKIAQQLTAEYCESTKQIECADKAYQSLYRIDSHSVAAYYGMGWVSFQHKQKNKAYDFVRSGMQLDAQYIPLIELRERLESE